VEVTPRPVRRAPAPSASFLYWQVDEDEAETVLVAVIKSSRGSDTREIPLKSYPPGEWPPGFVSESAGVLHGTSPNGRKFAVYESFAVDDDPSPGVTLRLSSVPGGLLGLGFAAGGYRTRLTVPLGRHSEHRLSEDATLVVSFREPKRAPPAGPSWERELELERERDDGDRVPLPPPWGAPH
jgi:hypothetical protein